MLSVNLEMFLSSITSLIISNRKQLTEQNRVLVLLDKQTSDSSAVNIIP